MSIQQKKQIVSLIGKDKMPQSAVTADMDFIVDEKFTVSILFNVNKTDEFIEALSGNDHVTDIYIVAQDNRVLKQIKDRINEEIGDITLSEPLKIPMSDGFKANTAYFKLGFLDRTSVSLGEEFSKLIPILWLKSGVKSACPEVDPGNADREYYIFSANGFAILPDERHFKAFMEALAAHPEIRVAYLITNSESSYHSMSRQIDSVATVQLYKDYLDNFSINRGGRR